MRFVRRGALAALALTLIAGPAVAQEAAPAPVPADSLEAAIAQFRTLQQRLATVQDSALTANPELQAEQASIQQDMETAMFEAHPDLKVAVEQRLPAIQQEAQAAQQAQDTTALETLAAEYQGIMGRLETAQIEVVEQQAVKARLESFQEAMRTAMAEIDPEIEQVFRQLQTLGGRLDRTLGG